MIEPQASQSFLQMVLTKRNLMVFGAFVLGCALTGYFFARKDATPPEHVPLIKADATPYKIRPENEEQPQIPHEDKLVYNRLAPNSDHAKVERLLPSPEQPILIETEKEYEAETITEVIEDKMPLDRDEMFPRATKPSAPAPKVVHAPVAKVVRKKPEVREILALPPAVPKVKPRAPAKAKTVPTASVVPAAKVVPKLRPVQTKRQVKSAAPAPKPVKPTPAARANSTKAVIPVRKASYRVQLAAMRTPTLARQEWHRLVAINPQLKNLTPQFVRVDLGARKGIFYRVQSGKFTTQEQAQRLCQQLKRSTPQLPCMAVPIDQ